MESFKKVNVLKKSDVIRPPTLVTCSYIDINIIPLHAPYELLQCSCDYEHFSSSFIPSFKLFFMLIIT